MTKSSNKLWRGLTYPFRLIFNIIAYPFRLIHRSIQFLNTDVEDRPILDTFSSLAAEEEARVSFWGHIEELRMHLLRILVGTIFFQE